MSVTTRQRYPLIVLSRAPYAGSAARAALDLALSFAVFNQQPRLLFCGDGVLQLAPEQDPAAMGRKSLRRVIDSLPLYDVDVIFADAVDLERHGLDERGLPDTLRPLDRDGVAALRAEAGHLLSL